MITWHTSKTDNTLVSELCYLSESDTRPAASNMAPRNWQLSPETLLYKLTSEQLYDTGGYGVWSQNGIPQAGGGWHRLSWHPDIVLQGSRSYTLPGCDIKYLQSELWCQQYSEARLSGAKVVLGSFNHYNRKMVSQAIKINDPRNHKRSYYKNGWWYREPGIKILPLRTLDHSVNIHHTEQWIVYHVIDWDFYNEFLDICKNNQFGR